MSAYVNFYLRVNDNFAPIGSFSRSSVIYEMTNSDLPWEKMKPIKKSTLDDWVKDIETKSQHLAKMKKENEDKCAQIMTIANNPLEEKLDAVASIERDCDEINECIEECTCAIHTFLCFYDMIEDYQYSGDEDQFENDYNHYIYAGIEVSGKLENVAADE